MLPTYSSVARIVAFSAIALIVPYGCSSTATGVTDTEDAGGELGDGSVVNGDAHAASDGGHPGMDAEVGDAMTAMDTSVTDGSALDGSLPDGAVLDGAVADSGQDSGFDAGQDAGHDSGVDSGPDSGPDGGTCTPGNVSSFVPVFKAPTAFHQNQCSGAQITNFYTYCLGPASDNTDCNNWVTANNACDVCLLSAQASTTYGPLVVLPNGFVQVNIAGCIYNATVADRPCAMSYQAEVQCENAACTGATCPNPDNTEFAACEDNAQTGNCSAYQTAANCINSITNLDTASACFAGATFQANYTTVATAFCGP